MHGISFELEIICLFAQMSDCISITVLQGRSEKHRLDKLLSGIFYLSASSKLKFLT